MTTKTHEIIVFHCAVHKTRRKSKRERAREHMAFCGRHSLFTLCIHFFSLFFVFSFVFYACIDIKHIKNIWEDTTLLHYSNALDDKELNFILNYAAYIQRHHHTISVAKLQLIKLKCLLYFRCFMCWL